ncbi:MAG TPA: signal peptidase I [Gaiellaceae bacterium]|jgi:signal peptidase I|nr:signal peptidase I [Gaiellaceae bacterium]
MRGPLYRLPRRPRVVADWLLTVGVAVGIVLGVKAWVVNPYRIPSSSMEPTLRCARPASGCEATTDDRVLANRLVYHFRDPKRGDIVVFDTPRKAVTACGEGGTYVKRLIGLPGDTWSEKGGYVYIDGKKLSEPYVQDTRRDAEDWPPRRIAPGHYFFMGDNRKFSCDSRKWGTVPRKNLIGEVFATYWPPDRIGLD